MSGILRDLIDGGGVDQSYTKIIYQLSIGELRKNDVQQILSKLEKGYSGYEILEKSRWDGGIKLLNRSGLLSRNVYRLLDYFPSREAFNILSVGLYLQSNIHAPEVAYNEGFACCIPRFHDFHCGLSCSFDKTFSLRYEILGSEIHPFSNSQLKKKYGKYSKAFYVARLEENDKVDPATWHDEANSDCNHVTISPARDVEALEILECKNKVRIPLLEQLPWIVDGEVLILMARAEWRDDFLPDSDEWSICVTVTFNRILAVGGADDFLNVWRLHRMISADFVGTDAKQDFGKIITFAIAIVSSYLDDLDLHDPNDPDTEAHAALKYLNTLHARFFIFFGFCTTFLIYLDVLYFKKNLQIN